jgi:hypothetical protein
VPRETVSARFATREALLQAWDETRPDGALFVPVVQPPAPGTPVVVAFVGRALGERLFLRGTIERVQAANPRLRLRAGALVVFDASERPAVDYLLALARGESAAPRRRQAPRVPVSLETTYRHVGRRESCPAEVVDLSAGGLSLRVAEAPPPASHLVVRLPVPGAVSALELAGEVVFVAPPGDRIGVRFEWHGMAGVRGLREVLRRLLAGASSLPGVAPSPSTPPPRFAPSKVGDAAGRGPRLPRPALTRGGPPPLRAAPWGRCTRSRRPGCRTTSGSGRWDSRRRGARWRSGRS